ncbi:DUF5667 domain-containing protein, partial [Streptomyces sp. MB09-02B]|uniref:DUF5667 domain-containing protein n=1 Tax=Streptomyces sp. MB09-02B TaxID=3028667 RepID=UPI0029B2CAD8
MIANVSAHRRANAFAQALEELSDRGTAAEQPEGSAPAPAVERTERGRMVALTIGLDELPKPVLDPEVKVVHRAQLVAAMEAMLRDGTLPGREASDPSVPEQRSGKGRGAHRASPLGKLRPRSRLTKGLAAGGLSVGVAASAFGGVAAASSDALPGDSLYGLKRGIEDVKLTLADDNDDRGRLYLDQASTRLSEARRLMERGRSGHLDHESLGEIRRALTGMRHDAAEGHRLLHEAFERDPGSLGPIQALSAFSRSHREAWGALRDRLPVQLGDVSQQVSSVFDAIDDEVAPHSSLLPQPPAPGGDGKQRSTGSGSPGTTAPGGRPAPSSTGGSVGGSEDTGGKPKPSTSNSDSGGEGLVGGTTGGLLDPPQDDTASSSPSTGRSTPPEDPDVT